MKPSRLFALLAVAGVIGLGAPRAEAVVLWNQGPVDPSGNNIVDQVFPDLPTFSTYIVGDVSFATAVTITDITGFFLPFITSPGATVSAELTLFSKTGSLPATTDLPGNLGPFTASYTVASGMAEITVSSLSLNVAAGDYWVGVTPVAPLNPNGQIFHLGATASIGDPSAARNPGGGFGAGTDWFVAGNLAPYDDMSLRILGDAQAAPVVAPSSLLLLTSVAITGAVAHAYRNFRRKSS